jgi:uncharacterized membrane protein
VTNDLTFVWAGLIFVVVGIPLMLRWVPPNRWYGLRSLATRADDWVWYEANAKSGRDFIIVGIIQALVAAGVAYLPGLSTRAHTQINLTVLVGSNLVVAGIGVWRAIRLLEQRRRGRE